MKFTVIALMAMISTVATQARPFHRPVIRPEVRDVCVVNLEKETYVGGRVGYRYTFEQAFTEFGPRACEMAENACERERLRKWDSWNYRCEEDFNARPGHGRRTCEYRIETRMGYTADIYTGRGRDACFEAEEACKRDLKYKQALGRFNGGVGPFAKCVQTSGDRPGPGRPQPRLVTASCTAAQFFNGNRGTVTRTAVPPFTASASARSYQEAEQRACDEAVAQCNSVTRGGRFSCQVIR